MLNFPQSAPSLLHVEALFYFYPLKVKLNLIPIIFLTVFPPIPENVFGMQSTYLIYSCRGNVISPNICSLLTLKTSVCVLLNKLL